jgi:hypothetical protein
VIRHAERLGAVLILERTKVNTHVVDSVSGEPLLCLVDGQTSLTNVADVVAIT